MEHTLDQFGKEKITPHPTRTAAIVPVSYTHLTLPTN